MLVRVQCVAILTSLFVVSWSIHQGDIDIVCHLYFTMYVAHCLSFFLLGFVEPALICIVVLIAIVVVH